MSQRRELVAYEEKLTQENKRLAAYADLHQFDSYQPQKPYQGELNKTTKLFQEIKKAFDKIDQVKAALELAKQNDEKFNQMIAATDAYYDLLVHLLSQKFVDETREIYRLKETDFYADQRVHQRLIENLTLLMPIVQSFADLLDAKQHQKPDKRILTALKRHILSASIAINKEHDEIASAQFRSTAGAWAAAIFVSMFALGIVGACLSDALIAALVLSAAALVPWVAPALALMVFIGFVGAMVSAVFVGSVPKPTYEFDKFTSAIQSGFGLFLPKREEAVAPIKLEPTFKAA